MKVYYPFRKGLLRFECSTKTWKVFYPRKGAKANRSGEILNRDQARVIFQNYRMTGKPIVHRGGASE